MASAMVSHEGNFDVLEISRRSEEGISRAMMEMQRRRRSEERRSEEEEEKEKETEISDARMGGGNQEYSSNMDLLKIPTGFRFAPTDVELVKYYLYPKVLGEALPPNRIDLMDETDLYSKPPSELDLSSWDGKECFFFTHEDIYSYDGLVSIRTVGNGIGYWKLIGKEKIYYHCRGHKFAFKCRWTYFNGTPQKRKRTKWAMTQYQIKMKDKKDEDDDNCKWIVGRIKNGSNYRSSFP